MSTATTTAPTSPATSLALDAPERRCLALDALRGLAILMMCLSGLVPNHLPNWMYHGYYPRFLPDAAGNWQPVADPWTHRPEWASFTWVDWVFPMFLFAMGAAFPFALSRRLQRGASRRRLVLAVLGRGVLLVLFAAYVQHITPGAIQDPPALGAWLIALFGFLLLFPVLTRLPADWSFRWRLGLRSAGVSAAVCLLAGLDFADGTGFRWSRTDIIILILANLAVWGSLIWLLTRHHPYWRLLTLAIPLVGHQLARGEWQWPVFDPLLHWPERALNLTWIVDTPVLDLSHWYDFTFTKFLFIVIPGTIVGDLLLRWMRRPADRDASSDDAAPDPPKPVGAARLAAVAGLLLAVVLAVLVGLQHHGHAVAALGPVALRTPWLAAALALPLLALAALALDRPRHADARLVAALAAWGAATLLLGLALDLNEYLALLPFDHYGITKGPPVTLSYYFVSTGLSILLLASLVVWIDLLPARRPFRLLIDNGQNPMIAYVGIRSLLAPLVNLPILRPFSAADGPDSLDQLFLQHVFDTPWSRLVWALAKTLLLAVIVSAFTRRRVFWRT